MKLSDIETTWDLAKACAEHQGGSTLSHYIKILVKRFDAWTSEIVIAIGKWLRK